MNKPTPNPTWSTLHVTATRPDTDSGTVAFSRQDTAGKIEQRNIQVRYGGRSIVFLALFGAAWVLSILHHDNYALFLMTLAAIVASGTAIKYRATLMWITGYDPDSKRKH